MARLDTEEARAHALHVERQQQRADALCRRIRQALVDLGLEHLQNWAESMDGAVSFGDLEPRSAERFVEMLEVVAVRTRRGW